MWTILSPIWSKLWDAKVFLPADCVRRAFCLGHARVYVRSPRRESALRAKVFLAADCVRRAFCLGHARLCALPAQKARLSCQQPKILLARGTVQGGKQSAHDCCRLRQTDFLFGACTSVAPAWPHSWLHHFIYPLFDTKQQCVAHWRTKNKKVVEIGQISGQFSTTFFVITDKKGGFSTRGPHRRT